MDESKPTIISEQEMRDLIADILGSAVFSKGEVVNKMLTFLFETHVVSPDKPPTQKQILSAVWEATVSFEDQKGKVRAAAARLRSLLADYYRTEGSKQALILSMPIHRYALHFERRADSAAILRKWFWGSYLMRASPCYFGVIPEPDARFIEMRDRRNPQVAPDERRSGRIYPYLRTYSHFARILRPRNLKIVPPGWEVEDGRYYVAFRNNIFVGDDVCFALGMVPMDSSDDEMTCEESSQLSYVAAERFQLTMLRSKDRTMVLNADGSPPYADTETKGHVLLTRFTSTTNSTQQTVLCGRSIRTVEKVARFITQKDGLSQIEALPEMRGATKELREIWKGLKPSKFRYGPTEEQYWGGAPYEFQILFSTSIEGEERPRRDVTIELCFVPPIGVYQ